MKHKLPTLFASLVFVVLCFASAATARADAITSNNIAVVQGVIAANASDTVNAGTFTFTIPSGQTITAASLTGSAQYNLQVGASISLLLDNNSIGTLSGVAAASPINIALNPSVFASLADGTSILTLSRLGGTFGGNYNLFSLQLNITTGPGAPVPEPATIVLLGTGLVGTLGALRKRRKK